MGRTLWRLDNTPISDAVFHPEDETPVSNDFGTLINADLLNADLPGFKLANTSGYQCSRHSVSEDAPASGNAVTRWTECPRVYSPETTIATDGSLAVTENVVRGSTQNAPLFLNYFTEFPCPNARAGL